MNEWQKKHLRANLPDLLTNTTCNAQLLAVLESGRELSKADIASITCLPNKYDQNHLLYGILETRINGYGQLARALAECRQSGSFNTLVKGFISHLVSQFMAPQQETGETVPPPESVVKRIVDQCTPENFIQMYQTDCSKDLDNIKLVRHTIPSEYKHYISRTLSKRLVIDQKLFTIECPDLFVFKNFGHFQLSNLVSSQQVASSESYLQEVNLAVRFIVLIADTDWEEICEERKGPVHLVKYEKLTNKFFLEETTGDSQILTQYLRRSQDLTDGKKESGGATITEQEFIQEVADTKGKCKGYCICDSPGMGKTLLLANLARSFEKRFPERIVSFIRLSELMEIMQPDEEQEKVGDILLEYLSTCPMSKCILNELYKAGILHLELFLDGLDEVFHHQIPDTLKFISSKLTCLPNTRIYVTSRSHLRQSLETSLGVISFDILPFTFEKKKRFVAGIWHEKDSSQDSVLLSKFADYCIKEFEKRFSKDEREITGIPLQCNILANVYAKKAKRYCTSKGKVCMLQSFKMEKSLPQLYRKYVEQLLEKCSQLFGTPHGNTVARNYHTWVALKTIFPEIAHSFALEFKVNTISQDTIMFSAGLVEIRVGRSGESIEFVHRTFAEFMASEFFVKTLEEDASKWTETFRSAVIQFQLVTVLGFPGDNYEVDGSIPIGRLLFGLFPEFQYPVTTYFINHALSEKQPLWFSNNENIIGCAPPHLQSISLLEMCLRQNYTGIFRLISICTPFVKRPDSLTIWYLVSTAVQHSSVSLIDLICTLISDRFQYNVFKDGEGKGGDSFLKSAVRRGDFQIAKYFIDKMPVQGENLIAFCINCSERMPAPETDSKIDICELLLNKDPKLLEEINEEHLSNYLILSGVHVRLVNWIIEKGANPLSAAWDDGLAFFQSILSSENDELYETCSLFIKHMNNADIRQAFTVKVKGWRSWLHYIFVRRLRPMELRTIRLIVQKCDARRLQDEEFLNTLLLTALGTGQNNQVLDFLFQHHPRVSELPTGAKNVISYFRLLRIDNSHLDDEQTTFLHLASEHFGSEEFHDIVSFLHIQGHAPLFRQTNGDGMLAVHRAVEYMEVKQETLKLFLDNGVDINATEGRSGYTFLIRALRGKRSVNFLKTLIDMGVDVDKKDKFFHQSFTQHLRIHCSTEKCDEIIRYLEEKGKIGVQN